MNSSFSATSQLVTSSLPMLHDSWERKLDWLKFVQFSIIGPVSMALGLESGDTNVVEKSHFYEWMQVSEKL